MLTKKHYFMILFLCITGCVFETTQISLNSQVAPLSKGMLRISKPIHIKVGPIIDGRIYSDQYTLFHKLNAINETMPGKYVSAKPIAEIAQQMLINGLQQQGYILKAPYQYYLKGSITSISQNLVSEKVYVIKVQMELQLLNKQNKILWSNVLFDTGQTSGSVVTSSVVSENFHQALLNIIRQIQSSKTFRVALQKN